MTTNCSLVGRTVDVLVEGTDSRRAGHVLGTSCRHVSVSFPGYAPALLRRIVPIRVERLVEGQLLGEPIAAESPSLDRRSSLSGRFPPELVANRSVGSNCDSLILVQPVGHRLVHSDSCKLG